MCTQTGDFTPTDTYSQYILITPPLNTPYYCRSPKSSWSLQTISHPVNTPSLITHSLSYPLSHPINTPSLTLYQHTLSHTLSTHPIITTHPITVGHQKACGHSRLSHTLSHKTPSLITHPINTPSHNTTPYYCRSPKSSWSLQTISLVETNIQTTPPLMASPITEGTDLPFP